MGKVLEFNEKLQELRKNRGLTQEELAESLYVSRTAISKWESGRGYPGIDSLKAISGYFDISIDELLSGKELLSAAEADRKIQLSSLGSMVYALLDISLMLFFVIPVFALRTDGAVTELSMIELLEYKLSPISLGYYMLVIVLILCGIAGLVLKNSSKHMCKKFVMKFSLSVNIAAVIIFTLSLQPYPALFVFAFLIIKTIIYAKA